MADLPLAPRPEVIGPQDLVVAPSGLRFAGRRFPCTIGRGGITSDKREGDGATPRGVHRIIGVSYRPDRVAPPASGATPTRPGDLWSDDPADPHYNRKVRAPHPYSHERLRLPDPRYDLILLTDWNLAAPRPGRGSAIFVHQWRGPGHPTAGCVGLPRPALHWIARRLRPGARLVVR